MATFYIGMKLGSTATHIYKPGNGIVLREASLIAMPTNLKVKDIKAIGNDAKKIIGKVSDNITIYSPISSGLIQYDDLAIAMLKEFLRKVFPNKKIGQNIKAILSAPLGISASEKKQLETVCFKAGIADVYIIPDVLCYALGSGIDIKSNSAHLVVNVGSDTTNIATISNHSIIKGFNFSIGGSIVSVAIAKYIEETYNINIGLEQADKVKVEICSLFENYAATMDIVGINKQTQLKDKITISSTELYPIVKHYYSKIAEAINSIIQSSDPEVVSDIIENGIHFYGGGTNIVGFERFMANETKFKINMADISGANMIGTGELIKYPQLLKKILKNN